MSDRVSQLAGHLNYPKGLLAGQVAIITGSGQGIGAEAARLFAKEGAKVVVADIDDSKMLSLFHGTLPDNNAYSLALQRNPKRWPRASTRAADRPLPWQATC